MPPAQWKDGPLCGSSACAPATVAQGRQEALTVLAALEVAVERPFSVAPSLWGPARTACLLLPTQVCARAR
jgi:hypothetical protein